MPASLLDDMLDGVELAVRVRACPLTAMMSYHDEEHVLYLLAGHRLFPESATGGLRHPVIDHLADTGKGALPIALLGTIHADDSRVHTLHPTHGSPPLAHAVATLRYLRRGKCEGVDTCPPGTAAALRQVVSTILAAGADAEAEVVFQDNLLSVDAYLGPLLANGLACADVESINTQAIVHDLSIDSRGYYFGEGTDNARSFKSIEVFAEKSRGDAAWFSYSQGKLQLDRATTETINSEEFDSHIFGDYTGKPWQADELSSLLQSETAMFGLSSINVSSYRDMVIAIGCGFLCHPWEDLDEDERNTNAHDAQANYSTKTANRICRGLVVVASGQAEGSRIFVRFKHMSEVDGLKDSDVNDNTVSVGEGHRASASRAENPHATIRDMHKLHEQIGLERPVRMEVEIAAAAAPGASGVRYNTSPSPT
ncbi:hypothetical protein FN846DRAFT_886260 [Sphaerosporella brunnea]|uniref:Uncharacterized protein n=1 Tax=Sphaerosporella brunnea TaxID=1250544 RepID=A0A5J5F9Z3_9PEZI|nr:hypothetical protein FN846DRAFT_886260 [Sphaerosporella brunnea]